MKIKLGQLRKLIKEAIEVESFRKNYEGIMPGCKECDDTKMKFCPRCGGGPRKVHCSMCEGHGEVSCNECGME